MIPDATVVVPTQPEASSLISILGEHGITCSATVRKSSVGDVVCHITLTDVCDRNELAGLLEWLQDHSTVRWFSLS